MLSCIYIYITDNRKFNKSYVFLRLDVLNNHLILI